MELIELTKESNTDSEMERFMNEIQEIESGESGAKANINEKKDKIADKKELKVN